MTLVAASGPLLVSVTVKVIVSPTLGVGSLDRLGRRPGRPAAASRWRWRCCCRCPGRTGRRALTVAVLVCAAGLTTRARSVSVGRGAGVDGADRPHAGRAVVGPLAGRRRDAA